MFNVKCNVSTEWKFLLQQEKAIAVIRASSFAEGLGCAEAVAKAGMKLIEITWNSHQPAELVAELRVRLPHCIVGVGTILTIADCQKAIASGAQFAFSPHCDPSIIKYCLQQQIPCVPGALSPTEIVNAYNAGASAVKVFPVSAMGGANYIKSLKAPLSNVPLIPTGGVTLDNAAEMISAGAMAVGLSGALFPAYLLKKQDYKKISHRASKLMSQLRQDKTFSSDR